MSTVLELARIESYRRRELTTVALVRLLLGIDLPSNIHRLTASNRLRNEVMLPVLDLARMAS